ncbi:uncharacterized protein LOC135501045 [Lineus longissimus]|uniref:uncharacterized protein LOC135501045 n=1 Tax=Lineus longissimus TaxID=88925 RepID=UPI00315CFE6A
MAVSTKTFRIISLIVGVICMTYGGSGFLFSVYTNAVRKKYNYTQLEVGVMSGTANFGAVSIFLPGISVEKLGVRPTAVFTILLSLSGYLLLWSATKMVAFYKFHSWLQDIYFFLAYLSGVYSYVIALVPNVANFQPKYRGTIVGLLDATFSAGTSIFVAIYGKCFVNSNTDDEENQDIGDFFLTLAILGAVTSSLGFWFLGYYKVEDISQDYVDLDGKETPAEELIAKEPVADITTSKTLLVDQLTWCDLIKDVDLQLLFWMFLLIIPVVGMYLQNVSVYLKSFRFQEYSTLFNILLPVFAVVGKFFGGVISDLLVHIIPRTGILLVNHLLLLLMVSTCIFLADNYYVLLITTVVVGLNFGSINTLTPTLFVDYFGLKYFPRTWGACATLGGVVALLLQGLFGVLYDAAATNPGEKFCYGTKCFEWSFFVAAILVLGGVICNVCLIKSRSR